MPAPLPQLGSIEPTVFLAGRDGALRQLVRVRVDNPGQPAPGSLLVQFGDHVTEASLGELAGGASTHEVWVPEAAQATAVSFALKVGGSPADARQLAWQPPRRWIVHVVQNSHHDLGYTDLPSNVLRAHDAWLDQAVDLADAARDFPEDAQFRIVIEQAWSLEHYLKGAAPERAARMIALLRSGQFELNALFGNLTTEICGHETLIRALYASHRLKRRHGIPLVSAEHNDITGVSWGLCLALAEAGIRFFCPGLPLYYNWGDLGIASFWDQEAVFGRAGPGGFWWEAPSGQRILFWCQNTGCGGDARPAMPGLEHGLERLSAQGYPYDVARWPVTGGARDNSPYVDGYARAIRDWNARWAYPRLVCSTNARFHADLAPRLRDSAPLPVWRGELPGQDYPVGATSTAAPTAVNRNTHAGLLTAEKLAAAAHAATGFDYPQDELDAAGEDCLIHDEHTWGFHFPAGPATAASQAEKSAHAYRAAALAHDVTNRALASIADQVRVAPAGPRARRLEGGAEVYGLIVFNAAHTARTAPLRAPLREFDNCGSTMAPVPSEADPGGGGYLRGVLLGHRWHLNLPPGLLEGRFDLIDASNGQAVPHQIVEVGAGDAVPYAAERDGAGSGSRRYGIFEEPGGLKRDLCFVAAGVPPLGYKTYWLAPRESKPRFRNPIKATSDTIENEYYRVTADAKAGGIVSIYDKAAERELLDPDGPHACGALVVRDPRGAEWRTASLKVRKGLSGPLCASLDIAGAARGHPAIAQSVALYAGVKQVHLSTRILKDATPLLDAHLAFPFRAAQPAFRYEGVLSAIQPVVDYLPGAQWDRVAVQNWVKVADGGFNILWSSLDAPVASLGGLWPGYVSPAHRCLVLTEEVKAHRRLTADDLTRGWIYSDVAYNNLGTNFAVSQAGDLLFRHVITTQAGEVSDGQAAAFGWDAVMPLACLLTQGSETGRQPASRSLASVDDPDVVLLTLKAAEDRRGVIVRLWNVGATPRQAVVRFDAAPIERAFRCTAAEEDGEELAHAGNSLQVGVPARGIATVRLITGAGYHAAAYG